MSENGNSTIPEAGASKPGAPALGGGVMPSSLSDLARRLGDAGAGGAPAATAAEQQPERRGLSELSLRVLGRWGALPLKAVAVFTGWAVGVAAEDAEILGECTVDLVRTSSVAPDPRAEAWGRWIIAHVGAAGEGYLATLERRLERQRAEQESKGA